MVSGLFQSIGNSINQDKGFAYGLINNAISYHQSKKQQAAAAQYAAMLQLQQYNLGQRGLRESPGNMRKGLESAGYNPMLAVGSVGSTPAVAGGTPVNANAAANPDLANNAAAAQHIINETNQTDSTVALQNAQTETEESKKDNYEFQNAMLDVEKHLKEKDLNTYDRRFYMNMYEQMQRAEKMRQEASVVGYNAESQRILSESGYYSANKQYNASKYNTDVNAEIQRKGNPFRMFSTKAGEHLESFRKDHPYWSNNPTFRFLHKTFN